MKKIFSLFFVLLALVFFSNIVLAEEFSFELYDVSTNVSTTTINWDVSKIIPGEDKWVWSTTYAIVKAKDIPINNTVYWIYQDNKNGSTYKAENFRTEEDKGIIYHRYNGLVNKDTKGGETKGFIPLSYVFTTSQLSSSDFEKEYEPEISVGGDEVAIDKSGRFFMDKSDMYMDGDVEKSNFEKNNGYCAIAGSDKTKTQESMGQGPVFWYYDETYGIDGWVRWSSKKITTPASTATHTAYMYFGANFKNASRNDIFGTDKIVIERFSE